MIQAYGPYICLIIIEPHRLKPRLKRIGRYFFITFSLLVIAGFMISWAVTLPGAQTWLVKQGRWYLERKIGTPVELEAVKVGLPLDAVLEGIRIEDEQGAELLTIQALRLHLFNFSLIGYVLQDSDDPPEDLIVSDVKVEAPRLFLYKRQSDGELNLRFLLDAFRRKQKPKTPGRSLRLDLTGVTVSNGSLTYRDSTNFRALPTRAGQVNFRNLTLDNLEAHISALIVPDGLWDIQLTSFAAQETGSGMVIDQLSGSILAEAPTDLDSRARVIFDDLSFRQENTWIRAKVIFPDRSFPEVFSFDDAWQYKATLAPDCRVDMNTVNYLFADTLPLKGAFTLEGDLRGDLRQVKSDNIKIAYGEATRLQLNLEIDNLDRGSKAPFRIKMRPSQISFIEMQEIIPGIALPALLTDLDQLEILGLFEGNARDLDLNVRLNSEEVGALGADLSLTLPPVTPEITYDGFISSEDLNINALSLGELRPSERLTMEGRVRGKGTELETLELEMEGSMKASDLYGFLIDTARADFTLINQQLKGAFYIADPEGYGNLNLDLDLGERDAYLVQGHLDHFNLERYKLLKEPVRITSDLNIDAKGTHVDNITGRFELLNTRLDRLNDSTELSLGDLWFEAVENDSTHKYLNLKGPLVQMDLSGAFSVGQLETYGKRLWDETKRFITNEDSSLQDYYLNKRLDSTNLSIDLALAPGDSLNAFLEFIRLPAYIETGSLLTSKMTYVLSPDSSNASDEFSFNLSLDSAAYGPLTLKDGIGDFQIIKPALQNSVLLAGDFEAHTLHLGPTFELSDFAYHLQGLDREFESDIFLRQAQARGLAQVKFTTSFLEDGSIRTAIDSASSLVVVREDSFVFHTRDSIIIADGAIEFQNITLENPQKYLHLDGVISEDPESKVNFHASRLNLILFQDLYALPYEPGGFLSADITLSHLLKQPKIDVFSRLDDFSLGEHPYGTVFIQGGWQDQVSAVWGKLQMLDSLQEDTTLFVDAHYDLSDTISPLNAVLGTQKGFALNHLTPFVAGQLFGLEGRVALGDFSIKGPLDALKVDGVGHFTEAKFGVSYFKTEYNFDGRIIFDNDRITFPGIRIYDVNNNFADLHGGILHQGLRTFAFDLQLDSVQNFMVMNLRKGDNDFFYGKVFLDDGLADITGDLEKLNITAIAATGAGSSLKIPVSDEDEFGRPDFIRFAADEGEKEGDEVNTGLLGYELDFTIIATEEAEVELIFDERVGDIIRGRGNGVINMNIDPSGALTMFGDYEISKGDYLFTAQNVINKKFEVVPGGTLIWSGDPYNAEINLDAAYPLYADIKDLLQVENSVRAPVNVLMHMEGELMQPVITLSIELPSINERDTDRALATLRSIRLDEQELNKQVFSLMVFNRFAPIGDDLDFGLSSAGAGAITSISELLSNQLNYLISQVTNDKLSVNVGTNNFQDVNLLVSAKLFKDRVTIERDGTLIAGSGAEEGLLGNIRVIIKLKADNTTERVRPPELVLEIFNRENYGVGSGEEGNVSYEYGIGVFYKKDFNQLSELLRKSRKQKKGQAPDPEPEMPTDTLKIDPAIKEESDAGKESP